MEIETLKLQIETETITHILLRAQSSFKILDYLSRGRSGLEAQVISRNYFFRYTSDCHWQIYVVELSKLFGKDSPNNHFNLIGFINKFKQGGEYASLNKIDDTSIKIWEGDLSLKKESIDNLLLQRDKKFGHTDRKGEKVKNILTFGSAKELIEVVQRILSEINLLVFGHGTAFDPTGDPIIDLEKIMVILVNDKKRMINDYIDHCKELGIDPKEMELPDDHLEYSV